MDCAAIWCQILAELQFFFMYTSNNNNTIPSLLIYPWCHAASRVHKVLPGADKSLFGQAAAKLFKTKAEKVKCQ